MEDIYICKAIDYTNVRRKLEELIDEYGGLDIDSGDRVLLKPNLITSKFEAVTHPEFTLAAGDIVRDYGGKPEIADSSGPGKNAEEFKNIGYKSSKIPFYILDGLPTEIKNGFPLAKKVNEFDYIINLPKLKTHLLTTLTLGVKNLFGLIPGKTKKKYHVMYPDGFSFSRMLLALYRTVKTDITILDGIKGMDGNGPTNGRIIKPGIIALSSDAMVLDYSISELLKIDDFPLKRIYIENFGEMEVKIHGEVFGLPELKLPDSKIRIIPRMDRFIKLINHRIPAPVRNKCILCGDCRENCPTEAIKIEHNNVYINYTKCIECFTCLEVCPSNALEVKNYIGFLTQ